MIRFALRWKGSWRNACCCRRMQSQRGAPDTSPKTPLISCFAPSLCHNVVPAADECAAQGERRAAQHCARLPRGRAAGEGWMGGAQTGVRWQAARSPLPAWHVWVVRRPSLAPFTACLHPFSPSAPPPSPASSAMLRGVGVRRRQPWRRRARCSSMWSCWAARTCRPGRSGLSAWARWVGGVGGRWWIWGGAGRGVGRQMG